MPAPDLKPQVPGGTAEPTQPATDTPLQALIKQTVVLITEALPGLTARDLVELRDLETAGDNRKGVLQAIEAEDKRREAVANSDADPESTPDPLPAELSVVVAGALFDFLGFLTTRDTVIALGATEEAGAAVEAVSEWAATRGLSLDEAAVGGWREIGIELATPAVFVDQYEPLRMGRPAEATPNPVAAAGQAVLTDQGWVVPEPPKKG